MMKITYTGDPVILFDMNGETIELHLDSQQNRLFVYFIMSLLTSESMQINGKKFQKILEHAINESEIELDYDFDDDRPFGGLADGLF